MNNNINIRQATIEDLPKLVPIFDSYRQYFKQEKKPQEVESFLFTKFERMESVIFIAEQDNEIIGFVQLYPVFSSLSLQRVWLLNDFFISEGFRNFGIGKQLFSKVKDFTAHTKSKAIELTVEHENERAWVFWEKQGFKIDDEFRCYYYTF
jgi:ribosomal protein S18 acetylase RimI-like enzyme